MWLTWRMDTCDMTRWSEWHDSFVWGTWLIAFWIIPAHSNISEYQISEYDKLSCWHDRCGRPKRALRVTHPRTLWSWYHKLYFLNIRNCIITITMFRSGETDANNKERQLLNYPWLEDWYDSSTQRFHPQPLIDLAEPHLLLLWGLCSKTSIRHLHNKTRSNTMEKKRNALLQVSGN